MGRALSVTGAPDRAAVQAGRPVNEPARRPSPLA
jgi:hypothetical protein